MTANGPPQNTLYFGEPTALAIPPGRDTAAVPEGRSTPMLEQESTR